MELQLKFSLCHFVLSCTSCIVINSFGLSYQVQVTCALYYMDFEGRSDGRSIKNILAHVAPIKLVRSLCSFSGIFVTAFCPLEFCYDTFLAYVTVVSLLVGLKMKRWFTV